MRRLVLGLLLSLYAAPPQTVPTLRIEPEPGHAGWQLLLIQIDHHPYLQRSDHARL